jgi:uncharacterized DUF497 family protein
MVDSSKLDFSKLIGFEWDRGNLDHIKKHNVDYEECEEMFFNEGLIFFKDEKHSIFEERFKVFGNSNKNRKLALVVTVRKYKVRVIMARDQNKRERGDLSK